MTGSLVDGLVDAGFAAGWRVVRLLPERWAAAAFRAAADVALRRAGPGVRQLRANLRRVLRDVSPENLEVVVRAGMRSYARYWCETFRLPSMDPVEVHDRLDPHVVGVAEHLAPALNRDRGVIVALPHSGNWDVAAVWMIEHLRREGRPPVLTTVAERLRPEALFRRFAAYRESLGMEVLATGDGAAASFRRLVRRLRDGGVVALVADRDLSRTGVPVEFFGERTRLPPGPAQLVALTGAALVPTHHRFTAHGWAMSFEAPIPVPGRADVASAVQALADSFAGRIAADPQDWHMLQPFWLADLPIDQREAVG